MVRLQKEFTHTSKRKRVSVNQSLPKPRFGSRLRFGFRNLRFLGKKLVLRRLPGKGCIESLIEPHNTTESHGERACYYALGCE